MYALYSELCLLSRHVQSMLTESCMKAGTDVQPQLLSLVTDMVVTPC